MQFVLFLSSDYFDFLLGENLRNLHIIPSRNKGSLGVRKRHDNEDSLPMCQSPPLNGVLFLKL